jgi:hypothetical protein
MPSSTRDSSWLLREIRSLFQVTLGAFLVVLLLPCETHAGNPGTWTATNPLTVHREFYAAVVLNNGKALITGGSNGTFLSTAELYDPATGTFSTTGPMAVGRVLHTATLLPNGTVLIAGGVTPSGPTSEAEIYDPATGTFRAVGSMTVPRDDHTATFVDVQGGFVLIAGGEDANRNSLSSVEVFNVQSQTFTQITSLLTARKFHTATCFQACQKVLIAGGDNRTAALGDDFLQTAEILDLTSQPAAISFTASQMTVKRLQHTATLLENGNILLAGGSQGNAPTNNTAEIFSPATGTFVVVRGKLSVPRTGHSAVVLNNGLGSVLIAGGDDGNGNATNTVDVFQPVVGSILQASPMINARTNFTLLPLQNGQILAPGGGGNPAPLSGLVPISAAELYTPFVLLKCQTCISPHLAPPYVSFPFLSFCQEFPQDCHGTLLSETTALWGIAPYSIVYMPFPRLSGPSADLRERKFPVYYHIVIEGIGENWVAGVFDSGSNPIPTAQTLISDGVVLTLKFRNVAELQKTVERSLLAVQMTPKAVSGQQYKAVIHVQLSDREYSRAESNAKP